MLSQEELIRYSRHIRIAEVGMKGQEKLKNAKILVIGAGGLGCPVLLYLASAGIGTVGIVDFDNVELSNLQRQVLYSVADLGNNKAITAKTKLLAINPSIAVNAYSFPFTAEKAESLISGYDLVIDGTDNFATRYLINDTCVKLNKPLVFGSILQFEGQVSVFNYPLENGEKSGNYRDLFPIPPGPEDVPNCAEAGVLGVLPGLIGCLQANEAIKIVLGIGEVLYNKLLILNALSLEKRIIKYTRSHTETITNNNYPGICNFDKIKTSSMKEITVEQLQKKLENKEDFQLIDVREDFEYEIANLGGELIPLGTIFDSVDQISKDKQVIIHCKSGGRSGTAVSELEKRYGFDNLYNLKGGITAYAREIDPSIPLY